MMTTSWNELARSYLRRREYNKVLPVDHRALVDKLLARYPSKWAVFRELIANAVDASAESVKICIETSPSTSFSPAHTSAPSLNDVTDHNIVRRIVVHNDGLPFRTEDWNILTSIADDNPDMGSGFHSVFKVSDEPIVHSGAETLVFKWKGKTLRSERLTLPPDQHIDGTRIELECNKTDTKVPNLLELGQFLAASLTSVGLSRIELWLDEWRVLSLDKNVRSRSLASTEDIKTDTEHMKIQEVETGIMQIHGIWLDAIYKETKAPPVARTTSTSGPITAEIHAPGLLVHKGPETPTTTLKTVLAAFSDEAPRSPKPAPAGRHQPVERSPSVKQDLSNTDEPSPKVLHATVYMRITTATVSTHFGSEVASGIEAATKKKPTDSTLVSILTSCDEISDSCPLFKSIIPSKSEPGKIFPGFSTPQTTGIQAHILMQSIPTADRGLIDLSTEHVRSWNEELLQVAGIMGRIVWAEETKTIKNHDTTVKGWTLEKKGWTLEKRNRQLPAASRLLAQFDFQASTPLPEVGSIIEEHFWKACDYVDIVLTQGVCRSTDVRLENVHLKEVLNDHPVLSQRFVSQHKNFVLNLQSRGLISEIKAKDIEHELSSKTIDGRQLVKLFDWASKQNTEPTQSILSAIKAATVKEPGRSAISLNTVKYFAAYEIPNELLPPDVIPFTHSQEYMSSIWFQEIGWQPLPVEEWLRLSAGVLKEFMKIPSGAEEVLAIVSSNLREQDYGKVVQYLSLIPTDVGTRIPTKSYFRSNHPFRGLPYVKVMPGVRRGLLEILGVRKVVEMDLILDHVQSATNQAEMLKAYVAYLTEIPRPLAGTERETIRAAKIWHAEGETEKEGYRSDRKYTLTELFEPSEQLRELKVPTLYLPQGYRQEGPEGRLLSSLGLRRYLSVPELVRIIDEDSKLQMLDSCVSYLTKNLLPLSLENKEILCFSRIWHAEDATKEKGYISDKKYELNELFEPSDQLRELGVPILYMPQEYRQGGPEGQLFRQLGLRTRLTIPELIEIMDKTEDVQILKACISYLIETFRVLSDTERETIRTASIWYAGSRNDEGYESDEKHTLNKLFEPSEQLRELKVPILYLPQGYRQEGPEGRFFRPLGLKTYPSVPQLINVVTKAISGGDHILRDYGLGYFVRYFEINRYHEYDFANVTEEFLPLEESPDKHAAPKDCFTNDQAALLGFSILRKDLHGSAAKFMVKSNPPLSLCIDRLVQKPPRTRQEADDIFAYLVSFWREELPLERLRASAIVPVSKPAGRGTSNDAERNDVTLLHSTPPTCFIGILDGEFKELAGLFQCEPYSDKAAQFLKDCGASDTLTTNDIAERFLADPDRALEVMKSPEAYNKWFAWLGERYKENQICPKIMEDMKTTEFLLVTRYMAQENRTVMGWSAPSDAVVVDDFHLFNHFREHINMVLRDDRVESFSQLLGCKLLSYIVEESYDIIPLFGAHEVDNWTTRILIRSKIFLHAIGSSRAKVRWEDLKGNLQLNLTERINRYLELKGEKRREQKKALAIKEETAYIVYIVPDEDMPYFLGYELAKLFVKDPKPADALLFESIFQKSIDELQKRGYDTDRILGPDQQMTYQPIPHPEIEEPPVIDSDQETVICESLLQPTAKESREIGAGTQDDDGISRSQGKKQMGVSHQGAERLMGEHYENRGTPEFVNMDVGAMLDPYPMTTFAGDEAEDTRYFGELYVSELLDSVLGSDVYKPDVHWTSRLRSRNGHAQYKAVDPDCSTFTILERKGKLRESILRRGDGILLQDSCKIHIEVCATDEGLDSPFTLSNSQFRKARKTAIHKGEIASEVYILARVYNVRSDPGIALYVDPWRLQMEGLMSLQSQSSNQGRILKAAPAILAQDSSSRSFSGESNNIYQGLDVEPGEIRLLRLEPGEDSAPLRGSLVITSVDSPEPFWAISYVWGPKPTPLSPFYFETTEGKIPITESLATCLRCLRRKNVAAYLWADAVCINQEDSIEKSMQVRRMGSLYSRAERVIVWMGNDRHEESQAIEFLAKLQDRPEELLTRDISAVWRGINNVLQRPWFTRAWVIQELVLSPEVLVMCGNSEIGWDAFMRGLAEWENQLERSQLRGRDKLSLSNSWRAFALDRARKHFKGDQKKFNFLELLEMFFYTETSIPRDRLFALLNMAYDTGIEHEVFNPDYDSPEQALLAKYAEQFVKDWLVLDLLYRAGADKASDCCTWIPDLMNQRRNTEYAPSISTWEAAGSGGRRGFKAGAPHLPRAVLCGNVVVGSHVTPVLGITGIIFDTIQSCHPLRMGSGGMESDTLEDLRRYISHLDSYPNAGENWREELLIKCLIGDAIRPQTTSHIPAIGRSKQAKAEKWPEGFEKEVLADQDAHEYAAKSPESLALIDQFWQTAACFMRRIPRATVCITKKGYMGIVPGAAAAGNRIFIARGAKVPFVLEKKSTGHYALVGECYVHGLMYYRESKVGERREKEVCLV